MSATFIVVLFAAAATAVVAWRNSPLSSLDVACEPSRDDNFEKLAVYIIGDSWVAGNKMQKGFSDAAHSLGIDAVIYSRGISGGRTNDIAELLQPTFADAAQRDRGRRKILVIEGGINDKIANLGPDYYSSNVRLMVQAAVRCGYAPVVLTIPPFDKYGPTRSVLDITRWRAYALLSGDRTDSDATSYTDLMSKETVTQGAVIIRSDSYLALTDLSTKYIDKVHLSPSAMDVFARQVALEAFTKLRHPLSVETPNTNG